MKTLKQATLIVVFVCFAAVVAIADQEVQEIQVTGEGGTYREALNNALVNAIAQVSGFQMKSEEVRETKIKELAKYINDQSESSGEIDINTQGAVEFKTEGFVQNYEVLFKEVNQLGLHQVDILVKVSKYKTPGISPNSRRKIAIIPFRTASSNYKFISSDISSLEISRQFTQKLINEITQTRKFAVLDREYMDEFLNEKGIILSGDTPIEEQMKIGEVLGVDYLIVGTITDAGIKRQFSEIKALDETYYIDNATFIGDYRIIVMATRQIKWSDSINLTLKNRELKRIAPSMNPEEMQQAVLEEAAKKIVHLAVENIYPIRVSQIQPTGELILNQGGMTVEDGQTFDVFLPGEKVIDQYTGESLGAAETWAAKIQIIRVIPKMSYAKIIEGDLNNIRVGSICRRLVKSQETTKGNTQKIKPKW